MARIHLAVLSPTACGLRQVAQALCLRFTWKTALAVTKHLIADERFTAVTLRKVPHLESGGNSSVRGCYHRTPLRGKEIEAHNLSQVILWYSRRNESREGRNNTLP